MGKPPLKWGLLDDKITQELFLLLGGAPLCRKKANHFQTPIHF
jgi:hypothetical protein